MTTATHDGVFRALATSFLGHTPRWYKQAIAASLVFNVAAYFILGPLATGWLILAEFIFTLAMALKCFPLQPGGLLAVQAVALGLTDTHAVYQEGEQGLPVMLLELL